MSSSRRPATPTTSTPRAGVRLRQVVLIAPALEPVVEQLRAELGLGAPYADPVVAEWDIENAVLALGDTFVEVIAPVTSDSSAARFLAKHDGGGYMLIFQLDDLAAARARAADLGVRTTWSRDLPDASESHLHPADTGGCLISLADAHPAGSWRPGGPAWTGRVDVGPRGRLVGITLAVPEPAAVAARWATLLGASAQEQRLALDDGHVQFVAGDRVATQEISVVVPAEQRRRRTSITIGGARFALSDAPASP